MENNFVIAQQQNFWSVKIKHINALSYILFRKQYLAFYGNRFTLKSSIHSNSDVHFKHIDVHTYIHTSLSFK